MYWWTDSISGYSARTSLEDTLPEVVAEGERVGLVAHAYPLQAAPPSEIKRVANDALHTFARVQIFLDGNFVRGSLLEISAHAGRRGLRYFPGKR